jgi:hypothetical protein
VIEAKPSFPKRKAGDEIFGHELLISGCGWEQKRNGCSTRRRALEQRRRFCTKDYPWFVGLCRHLGRNGTVGRARTRKTTNESPEKRRGPLVAPGVSGCGPSKPDTLGR